MSHLGDKLKAYRVGKDWSQSQMATHIEVGFRTYQDMEKTGIVKKADVLERITKKTKIDTQFFANDENNQILPKQDGSGKLSDHEKYVALLESNNKTFERTIQLSLDALQETQKMIMAIVKTNQQNIDDLLSDNGRKLAEVRVQTSKRNASNLGVLLKTGSLSNDNG